MEQQQSSKEKMNFVIIDAINQMNTHYVQGHMDEYFRAFEICYQMVSERLSIDERMRMEADYSQMQKKADLILQREQNPDTRATYLTLLHTHFANYHRHYIMRGLAKIGITRQQMSGQVSITKEELDVMTRIIRDGQGLKSSINDAQEVRKNVAPE